jgi:hypothetical protein
MRYPLKRRLRGPRCRSLRLRTFSPPTRFDPRSFQSVDSGYTGPSKLVYIYIYIYIVTLWTRDGVWLLVRAFVLARRTWWYSCSKHTPWSLLLAVGLYSQPFTITLACSLERHFFPPPTENKVSVTSHITYFVYCYIISCVSLSPSFVSNCFTCLRVVFTSKTSGHCLRAVRAIEGYSFLLK